MNNSATKDATFLMRHAQVTELKNTAKVVELTKDTDLLTIRNREIVT